jgi:glycosyltransferase involved in cell wall biosynthesis
MKFESKISVVAPVYNNATALSELSSRLEATLGGSFSNYEVLFINDGSRDDSLKLLKKLAQNNSHLKVINLSRNFGQHPAICAGFENATGDYIVLMDADLQDSPEDIVKLYEKITSEACDVAYTIKSSDEKLFTSRVTSGLYHYLFSKIIGSKVPLNIGTFRMFSSHFLDEIKRYKEFNILYGPLMFFMGFKSTFVTLEHHERKYGKSAYTFSKRLKLAVNSLISYTDIPHKLSMYFGGLVLSISIIYGVTLLSQYLFFGSQLPGGTTLIIFILSIMLGSFMLFLGIIGGYLFRVYQEVLARPRYHIQEKINL